MELERLESLLRQALREAPRAPLTRECLGIQSILGLLDRPEKAGPDDVRHLTTCPYCQWAAGLARRHRHVLEAPGDAEPATEGVAAPDRERVTPERQAVPAQRAAKLGPWLVRWPAVAGIAAVIVVAVGLGWWLTREPDLFGPVTGQLELASVTRGDEEPEKKYVVVVELNADGYLTFLYVDHTRELKLPPNATEQAESVPSGARRQFGVTVTHDPPGPQWIAAVASDKPFDPLTLRNRLQSAIEALSEEAPFEDLVERLERSLREHRGLSFRGHRFEILATNAP